MLLLDIAGDRLKIIKELNLDVLVLGHVPWVREEIERELKEGG